MFTLKRRPNTSTRRSTSPRWIAADTAFIVVTTSSVNRMSPFT
jgi:hypothetical protein